MRLNFKLRILCGTLALSLLMTACGGSNTEGTETGAITEGAQNVSVEQENTELVGTSGEETTVTLTEEQLEWQNYLLANVDNSLNVRAEADGEAEVVGRLEKGDRATVLEIGDEWTKISSGNVEGYVSNEYCVYGTDALNLAKEICDTVATSTTDGLRIRQEASTESAVLARLDTGDQVLVDLTTIAEEGWVAVLYKGATGYVSAEYVTVALDVGTGLTMEEIYEIRAAEAAAAAAAEAKASSSTTTSSTTSTTSSSSTTAEVDDLTLLAALIYCEAGSQGYDAQLGVGSVVMNRVRSGSYPNTVREVIYQKGQFGPAKTGKLARVIANGTATSSCYDAAAQALAGVDNTEGAIGFKLASSGQSGVVYGAIVFFK